MYFGPPKLPQEKTFTKSEPYFEAAMISDGVSAPAIINKSSLRAAATVGASSPGVTRNCAPASAHLLADSSSRTVPAPTNTSGIAFTNSRITSTAPGTVMVISTIGTPPWHTQSRISRSSRLRACVLMHHSLSIVPGADSRTSLAASWLNWELSVIAAALSHLAELLHNSVFSNAAFQKAKRSQSCACGNETGYVK